MPANITINSQGNAEMFYTGETPWHRLGTRLDSPATADEAIKAASMDWDVVSRPVYIRDEDSGFISVGNKQAIVRADTKEVFNVFSRSYTPLQNRDAFKFFDQVVGAGQAIYHTAGSLGGGRRVWILAQLPGTLEAAPGDELHKYVLLSNSHDGSLAVSMKITPIRVVCQNTLEAALVGDNGKTFRTEHQGNVLNRVVEAREILELTSAYFDNFMAGVNQLVNTQINQSQLDVFTYKLFDLDPDVALSDQFHIKRMSVEQVNQLFEEGRGQDISSIRGTGWALYNAVTEYADYYRPVGSSQASFGNAEFQDRRLDSSWFGPGAALKRKAWNLLQQPDQLQMATAS